MVSVRTPEVVPARSSKLGKYSVDNYTNFFGLNTLIVIVNSSYSSYCHNKKGVVKSGYMDLQ